MIILFVLGLVLFGVLIKKIKKKKELRLHIDYDFILGQWAGWSQDYANPYFPVLYWRPIPIRGKLSLACLGFVTHTVGADPQAKPLCSNAISQSYIYENSYKHVAVWDYFHFHYKGPGYQQQSSVKHESGCICFLAPAAGCISSSPIWLTRQTRPWKILNPQSLVLPVIQL